MHPSQIVSRSAMAITWDVWRALFLREAVGRLSARRFAWVWLLLEPVFHVAYLMVLFTVIRIRTVGGIDTPLWIMVGLLAYFIFKNSGVQGKNAINANKALFVYRQVRPVDCVLVRCALEGFLLVFVTAVLFVGYGLIGYSPTPRNLLAVVEAFLGLWLLGTGFGLMTSVFTELLPELDKIISLFLTPLYFVSGVIFPLANVPDPYRGWLMLNPIAHGVEAARLGLAPHYQVAPELSIPFLYGCAVVMVFLGLAMHVRFADQLVAQ